MAKKTQRDNQEDNLEVTENKENKTTKKRRRKRSSKTKDKNKQVESPEENQEQKTNDVTEDEKALIVEFPRDDGFIRLKIKPFDLRYLAELIDIIREHYPEFFKPLTQRILQDLPDLVEVLEDSIPINKELLSSPIPYTPGKSNCNPLTFDELKILIDRIVAFASIMPPDEWVAKLAETDVSQYYDDIHRPDNTFFTFRGDQLLVIKVDPIDFLDAAEILDRLQAQQIEAQQAQIEGRKPKLIWSQKWLVEHLVPRFPQLLSCHPKSPVKIDISKTGSFNVDENPLYPYEISKLIDMVLQVSGVLPKDLQIFH